MLLFFYLPTFSVYSYIWIFQMDKLLLKGEKPQRVRHAILSIALLQTKKLLTKNQNLWWLSRCLKQYKHAEDKRNRIEECLLFLFLLTLYLIYLFDKYFCTTRREIIIIRTLFICGKCSTKRQCQTFLLIR